MKVDPSFSEFDVAWWWYSNGKSAASGSWVDRINIFTGKVSNKRGWPHHSKNVNQTPRGPLNLEIWAKRWFSAKFKRGVRWKVWSPGLQRWRNVFNPSTRSWAIAEIPKIKKPPLLDFRLFHTFRNCRPIFTWEVSNERSCRRDEKRVTCCFNPFTRGGVIAEISKMAKYLALHSFRGWQSSLSLLRFVHLLTFWIIHKTYTTLSASFLCLKIL